jgi:polyisoprenyl-phosphate glycosyltransferase
MIQNASTGPVLSVIAPCYRCAACVPELVRRLHASLRPLTESYEIILVNDASPENDWEAIAAAAREDRRVKGVNLSRNFGQHHAITAGVDAATGDWIVVMDADLQDQPEEIPKLYAFAKENGYDVVFGRRADRRDAPLKKLGSRMFNGALNRLSDVRLDPTVANFSIASRLVMGAYRRLRESSRSHGLTLLWCGFRVGYLDVDHASRYAGETSYSLRRMVKLAIETITSRSNRPLYYSVYFGFLMAGASFLFGLTLIVRYLIWGVPVTGWSSLIVSLFFIGGLLMANMGVVGLYLGRVFDEIKGRPIYIVRERLNFEPAVAAPEPEMPHADQRR